ncbi:MAG: hypothetical protein U0350_36770 [Caldilineaceae bacterium]
MNSKTRQPIFPINQYRLARVSNVDLPVAQLLATGKQRALPVQIQMPLQSSFYDYAQIDPDLAAEEPNPHVNVPAPRPGIGYAGLTPSQRYQFLTWLANPSAAAPPAFQQLYLANLEVRLLEGAKKAETAQQELQSLQSAPAWQHHEALARTLLLSYWLKQDGAGLAAWLAEGFAPATIIGLSLGHLAILHAGLNSENLLQIAKSWELITMPVQTNVVALRLSSLANTLGAEPLAYALAQLDETALQPRPWRCIHRDLKLALPQPDLRPILEPLFKEMLVAVDVEARAEAAGETVETQETPKMEELGWHLILEFGHSRSEFFEFALELAQRVESYTQIADENRKLIHRVIFKKRDLRQFWRLWDYVQSWSSTQVFLNGEELPKWKIYPYSPYLK